MKRIAPLRRRTPLDTSDDSPANRSRSDYQGKALVENIN
jgi:hypothetical protein